MYDTAKHWITVAEVKGFTSAANRLFSISEMEALTELLALHPSAGEVIPETDGVRLLRWPAESQGKKAHVRVIYYFRDFNVPVYLVAIYGRGERLNLSSGHKRIIRDLVQELVATYGERLGAVYSPRDGAA